MGASCWYNASAHLVRSRSPGRLATHHDQGSLHRVLGARLHLSRGGDVRSGATLRDRTVAALPAPPGNRPPYRGCGACLRAGRVLRSARTARRCGKRPATAGRRAGDLAGSHVGCGPVRPTRARDARGLLPAVAANGVPASVRRAFLREWDRLHRPGQAPAAACDRPHPHPEPSAVLVVAPRIGELGAHLSASVQPDWLRVCPSEYH